jgi:hypothetical protein
MIPTLIISNDEVVLDSGLPLRSLIDGLGHVHLPRHAEQLAALAACSIPVVTTAGPEKQGSRRAENRCWQREILHPMDTSESNVLQYNAKTATGNAAYSIPSYSWGECQR